MPAASDEKERHPYHRRFIRHKVRLKVELQTKESYQSWSNNLSEEGVCFELPRELPVGGEVVVWIYLARTKQAPVQSRCRIVWNERAKKRFRHGGRFLLFADDGRERLRGYLADLSHSRPVSQPPPP